LRGLSVLRVIDAKRLHSQRTPMDGHIKIDICDFVGLAIAANFGGPHKRLEELLSKKDSMVDRMTRFGEAKFAGWIRACAYTNRDYVSRVR